MGHASVDQSLLTPVPGVSIRELGVPQTPEDPDLVACVGLLNDIEAELVGHHRLAETPQEAFPGWQPSSYRRRTRWVAESEGHVVALGGLALPTTEATATAHLGVSVHAAHRRRGIGGALHTLLERLAAEEGRSVLQTWATAGPVPEEEAGERIPSPTGFGTVDAAAPSTRFLLGHGYRLGQVERCSVLVPAEARAGLERARTQAADAAGADYEVLTWEGPAPERWAEDAAWLNSRMSTDAPSGELQVEEETWDVARLRESEDRHARSGRRMLTSLARHRPSDHLVAYTSLSLPTDDSVGEVFQWDTLVTREHRGHRLGMLIKATNLVELERRRPRTEAIFTWNAEENRPMLDVNEALGYRPDHWSGAWERRRT